MVVTTAQPPVAPSTYVPVEIKRAFRDLLASIAASDAKHGTRTPLTTLLHILDTARRLGVPQSELLNEEG